MSSNTNVTKGCLNCGRPCSRGYCSKRCYRGEATRKFSEASRIAGRGVYANGERFDQKKQEDLKGDLTNEDPEGSFFDWESPQVRNYTPR